ncbi:MAG: RluA family pseudouridine synthase [Chloroflexi bacterium]|nr:RluA family pseudouridine synthase [Chloroflexota bacterium]MBU1747739.1 RluA family pseudouridine synthase [Chloroflexota bacterium]MBU1878990.1 RluA family pseudouridine synthase [Chloroflexota bacterium]
MDPLSLTPTDQDHGKRLDAYLAAQTDLSRAQVQRLIVEGQVLVDGQPAKSSLRLVGGNTILVYLPPSDDEPALIPEAIPLHVVYEDREVLVIDKPAGLVIHPAVGHESGTLANALLARYPHLAGTDPEGRPGIVHRLDKDTSGLLVVGKTQRATDGLKAQFKDQAVRKRYTALVVGHVPTVQGLIDAPVGRHSRWRQRMTVRADGREARTRFTVLEAWPDYTLVEARPETGRTHQIRVHLAYIGHPVAGDPVYGPRKDRLNVGRQFLHASGLGFQQPITRKQLEFTSDLPDDLQRVLERLRGI